MKKKILLLLLLILMSTGLNVLNCGQNTIRGIVSAKNEDLIEDALVRLGTGNWESFSATKTDSSGSFEFDGDLESGTYLIYAVKKDYNINKMQDIKTLSLKNFTLFSCSGVKEINFQIEPMTGGWNFDESIQGKVIDSQGDPVDNAEVLLIISLDYSFLLSITNEYGQYTFTTINKDPTYGHYTIQASEGSKASQLEIIDFWPEDVWISVPDLVIPD